MLEARVLKGFKDTLPTEAILKRGFFHKIESCLRKFGYLPIDTPALEYKETLTGKSTEENDRQIYLFKDNGGRDIGLRFDLTVPLARYVVANEKDLTFPFKRFHIDKVWRGEKPQKGRFREFYQADFDILGVDSLASDVESIMLFHELLKELGIEEYEVHINDRRLFKEIFAKLGLSEHEAAVLRIIDKTYKVGIEKIKEELQSLVGGENLIKLEPLLGGAKENFTAWFSELKECYGLEHIRLEEIAKIFASLNLSHSTIVNPAITRGHDYYTGTVMEVYIKGKMDWGSIGGGGRYDNLTQMFSKTSIPGIGGSIGVDRIIAYLSEQGKISKEPQVEAVILNMADSLLPHYLKIATKLRDSNVSCEVYPSTAKFKKQFQYAEKKEAKYAVIIGEDELAQGIFKVKYLDRHVEESYSSVEEFIAVIK